MKTYLGAAAKIPWVCLYRGLYKVTLLPNKFNNTPAPQLQFKYNTLGSFR